MRTKSAIRVFFIGLAAAALLSGRADSGDDRCRSCELKVVPKGAAPAEPVGLLLDRLILQPAVSHGGITVHPLSWAGTPDAAAYTTLSQATEAKTLTVTELESASVPELKLTYRGRRPVFLMTGEVLTGARQDRILAHDILIDPSNKELKIPVYCVESGRWTEESREFSPAKNMATPNVRSKAQSKSSQGDVWNEVAVVNKSLDFEGGGSMQQGFEDKKLMEKRGEYLEALAGIPDRKTRVGAVVVVNGEIAGLDLFSSPALFSDLWPKLLESYALEAPDKTSDKAPGRSGVSAGEVRNFLGNIFDASYRELENPGAGAEFLIEAKEASGSALVADNKVLHLALFPGAPEPRPEDRPEPEPSPPPRNESNQINLPAQQIWNEVSDGPGTRASSFKEGGAEFSVSNPEKHKIETGE